MINGVVDIARKYDYTVILKITNGEQEIEEEVWKEVYAAQVDGVIYLNDELQERNIEQMKKMNVPVVLCNTQEELNRVPSVSIDFETAFYEATKKFINDGKKDILSFQHGVHIPLIHLKNADINARWKSMVYNRRLSVPRRININLPFFIDI